MLAFFKRCFESLLGWFDRDSLVKVAQDLLKWSASKTLLAMFYTTGIYILVYNIFVFMADKLHHIFATVIASNGTISPTTASLIGLAAFMANKLLLVESFSMMVTGTICHAIREMMPV